MENGRLRRIINDGMPEAVMMPGGQIWFRHYTISVHAIDRFVERSERPAEDLVPMLHVAFLACQSRARTKAIRRVIRVAESRGGYVLLSDRCYFVVIPDAENGRHVVTTVMTPRCMGTYKLAS